MSLSVACEVKVTSGVTASSLSTGVVAGNGTSSAVVAGIGKLMLGECPYAGWAESDIRETGVLEYLSGASDDVLGIDENTL